VRPRAATPSLRGETADRSERSDRWYDDQWCEDAIELARATAADGRPRRLAAPTGTAPRTHHDLTALAAGVLAHLDDAPWASLVEVHWVHDIDDATGRAGSELHLGRRPAGPITTRCC
jgi:hypothetical protein